ncbi:unnamed protein product [Boreogadus saida]
MRELGWFVLAAKKIDKSVKSLKDICDPTKFDLAVKAARRVSNYNAETNEYGKPSTAVKIGFSLKGATEAWIGHCLMTSDVLSEKRAKKFKQLLDSSWSTFVSTNAHSTMEQRRWNKEDSVPLTKDVVTLQNYLRKIEDEAKVTKNGKLLFAMEHGAGALKGKNLKTLDSVFFGKGHEATSTKGLRGVKERGTSNVDRRLEANDDGEQPQAHLSRVQLKDMMMMGVLMMGMERCDNRPAEDHLLRDKRRLQLKDRMMGVMMMEMENSHTCQPQAHLSRGQRRVQLKEGMMRVMMRVMMMGVERSDPRPQQDHLLRGERRLNETMMKIMIGLSQMERSYTSQHPLLRGERRLQLTEDVMMTMLQKHN